MKKTNNPFLNTGYRSPEYFCDREQETETLVSAMHNNRNVVLYSLRRLGKSGLIKNAFYYLSKNTDYHLVYIDILNTAKTEDFVDLLASKLLQIKNKSAYTKALNFVKRLSPSITFNAMTGESEFSFKYENARQAENNLDAIFKYFESINTKIVVAIDEFQRITDYPDANFEAFLRSKIQFLNNFSFIFSGSNRRLITSMFMDYNRPFYQSAELLHLNKLPEDVYADFIETKFIQTKRKITKEQIIDGIDWTHNHTYYTQNFFNKLWGKGALNIKDELILEIKMDIIHEKEKYFSDLRHLLPTNQLNLLKAIGKNGGIDQPSSIDFITKHGLGSTSTINSAVKSLLAKEMIYQEKGFYYLYDVYLERYFQYHHY